MQGLRFIIVFASVCFGLSFLTGIISAVGFGVVVLRSFIFALLAIITGVLVRIVVKKFLLTEEALSSQSTTAEEATSTVGNVVDIQVNDFDLPDDQLSDSFKFNSSNLAKEQVSSEPNHVIENSQNEAALESPERVSFAPVSPEALTTREEKKETDDLPKIDAVFDKSSNDSELIDTNEGEGSNLDSNKSTSAILDDNEFTKTTADDSNNEEIAKAIRTVLLRDG